MDVKVTIGCPLPNIMQYAVDVSARTRKCLEALKKYSTARGVQIHEIVKRGVNVGHNHNELVNEMWGDYILIVGSDHEFDESALISLLTVAEGELHPRIIGGVCAKRETPYRYVAIKMDPYGFRPSHIVPYRDFTPQDTMSGAVIEVDAIGSGFCLYHRSIFSEISYPWFCFAPIGAIRSELNNALDPKRIDRWIRGVESGNINTDEMREFAQSLKRIRAMQNVPIAWGPDYYFGVMAKRQGIKSYVHFGTVVNHLEWFSVRPVHYLEHCERSEYNLVNEYMYSVPATVDGVQEAKQELDRMRVERARTMMMMEEENASEKQGAEPVGEQSGGTQGAGGSESQGVGSGDQGEEVAGAGETEEKEVAAA